MKILIVCSGNRENFSFEKNKAFILDQIKAIKREFSDVEFETFFIKGKGIFGYLKHRNKLIQILKIGNYDCVHAHYSLSGLLANFQRRVPVITTFHGSDIYLTKNKLYSLLAEMLSKYTIYVNKQLREKAIYTAKNNSYIIPCGVDLNLFQPEEKKKAKRILGLDTEAKYVLFSSGFDVPVKNYYLAKKAMHKLNHNNVKLLELKGYSRNEVSLLFSAVDCALMTSFTEGSPQFIKEAMACNCPIVSTNVGDVKEIINNTIGCYISSYSAEEIANKIDKILEKDQRTNGREAILNYDNNRIANEVVNLYKKIASG